MSKTQLLKAAGVLAVFLIAAYFVFNWMMSAALHSRKEVLVPDVSKKTLFEAAKILSSFNLGMKLEGEEFNQDLPAGAIVRQAPYPGMTVKEGKIIKVTISQGGEFVYAPDLLNQPARSAGIALRSANLNLGEETTKYSLKIDKGNVISQDPKPGIVVEKDSLVNLVVSAGKPPKDLKLMPDLKAMTVDEAAKWAKDNNINLTINEEQSISAPNNTIISQNPEPDSEINGVTSAEVTAAVSNAQAAGSGVVFVYEVPQGTGNQDVRLAMIDSKGEQIVFSASRPSGSKIELNINPQGSAKMRIFINNVLAEEREIQ